MVEDKRASTQKVFASSVDAQVPFVDLLTWTFGNPSYDLDKPLFIDAASPDKFVSYNSALSTVRKLIGGLKANGMQPGDSLCMHSANNINYALVFLAVIGAGGSFVGANPHYTTLELTHLMTLSEVKYIIVELDSLKNMRAAAETAGVAPEKTFIFDTAVEYEGTEFKSWKSLLEYPESDWITFDDEHQAKNTVAALMSTSGTTGLPKAARCSHYSQVAQSILLMEDEKPYEVIRLLFLPQFHAFNAPLSLVAPIREGCTTYIIKRYSPTKFVEYLRAYQPTETTMVNPVIYKLLELSQDERRSCLNSLRAIWCGGVRLDSSVQNEFQQQLHPDAIVKQVWGLTEVGWATSFRYPEKDNTGSTGRLLPGMQARIIGKDGEDVQDEEDRGEILLRGPSLMMGYLKNDAATRETIVDGWMHTGDVGYQRQGKWYIVDRIKELIKVRGWQVSPAEIETCLFAHPAVADVAVIGVDFGDERGELPRAYVVLDPNHANIADEEIQRFLIGKLSKYKALDGGIRRVESLPRSSTGKVFKNVFKELAQKEILETRIGAAAVDEGGSGNNTVVDSDEERDDNPEDEQDSAVQSAVISILEEHEDAPVSMIDVEDELDVLYMSMPPVRKLCTEENVGLLAAEQQPEAIDEEAGELADVRGVEGFDGSNLGGVVEKNIKLDIDASDVKNVALPSMVDHNEYVTGGMAEVNKNLENLEVLEEANMGSAVLSGADGASKVSPAAVIVVTEKEVDA